MSRRFGLTSPRHLGRHRPPLPPKSLPTSTVEGKLVHHLLGDFSKVRKIHDWCHISESCNLLYCLISSGVFFHCSDAFQHFPCFLAWGGSDNDAEYLSLSRRYNFIADIRNIGSSQKSKSMVCPCGDKMYEISLLSPSRTIHKRSEYQLILIDHTFILADGRCRWRPCQILDRVKPM